MKKYAIVLLAFCIGLSACGRSSNVKTESATSEQTAAQSTGQTVVPAGTRFYGRLDTPIDSKTSHDGDRFILEQTDTLLHKNAALHGTKIEGHLENVQPAGMMKKPGMTLVFDDIVLPDGRKAPVDVQLVSMHAFDAKSHKLRTLGMMIGGAIASHELKKKTGKGGAAMGAVGGYALSQTMKTDISVRPGTILELKFRSPVNA